MDQGKEKEPCGNMALIVTKNDFYYTVMWCIGIFKVRDGLDISECAVNAVSGDTAKMLNCLVNSALGIASGVKALMAEPEYVDKVVVVDEDETLWDICSRINDDRKKGGIRQ